MSCEDFEMLMADALGDELADSDRARFEGHLAFCATCRGEYQSMVGAVKRMRSLPASDRVSEAIAREAVSVAIGSRRRSRVGLVYRYAASALLAFGAGYIFRGEVRTGSPDGVAIIAQRAGDSRPTLETALVSAHQKRPGGSRLSMAMMAMFAAE